MCYADKNIFAGPCKKIIDQVIQDVKNMVLYIEDKREVEDSLGISVDQPQDGWINIYQL